MTLLEKTLELAVGSADNNLAVIQAKQEVEHLDDLFDQVSNDRFGSDFRKIDKRKDKVLSGYSKIMALLSRANK